MWDDAILWASCIKRSLAQTHVHTVFEQWLGKRSRPAMDFVA